MIINTATGSIYEVDHKSNRYRKLSGDCVWQQAFGISDVVVGKRVEITLHLLDENGNVRTLSTSPVVSVSEDVN